MISKWATLHLLQMCGVYSRRKIMPQVVDFWNRENDVTFLILE